MTDHPKMGRPRKYARGTVRLSHRVPPETVRQLDVLAERWGCSRTEVLVRLAREAA